MCMGYDIDKWRDSQLNDYLDSQERDVEQEKEDYYDYMIEKAEDERQDSFDETRDD